jgi:hypothetical protein
MSTVPRFYGFISSVQVVLQVVPRSFSFNSQCADQIATLEDDRYVENEKNTNNRHFEKQKLVPAEDTLDHLDVAPQDDYFDLNLGNTGVPGEHGPVNKNKKARFSKTSSNHSITNRKKSFGCQFEARGQMTLSQSSKKRNRNPRPQTAKPVPTIAEIYEDAHKREQPVRRRVPPKLWPERFAKL